MPGGTRLALVACVALGAVIASAQESLFLTRDGVTAYSIYTGPDPAPCVAMAATELQRVVRLASGAAIPLADTPKPPMICLGENDAAAAAGVTPEALADDAFRILTRDGNVYILGKDSRRGQVGWGGSESRGTLYGAFAFLERAVGVRWLMPGDDGEDIPRQATIRFAPLTVVETPSFESRSLWARDEPERRWQARLGCGGARVQHGHTWDAFPARSVLRANPEYLALRGGRRMAVPADDTTPFQPKFCTTNPGLVQAFADALIAWLDQNPTQRFVSMSPSDGGGWCECQECSAYRVEAPSDSWGDFGGWGHSVTPLILRFYNDVARIVGARHPDRYVCGYVYYDFTHPIGEVRVEPNVALMLAPLQQYGLTRYKPEYRAEFERLCQAWGRASTFVGYYGASTWMRVGIGAPLGPSLPLLKHTFRTIRQNGFRAVYYYSLPWDSCGVHNYLAAKLMWNAEADVDGLFHEWLQRAYGPGAEPMARLYALLDREMEAYKQTAPRARSDYEMTSDLAMKVYLKHFWTLEALTAEALAKAATPVQRARVEAFGDNLAILHHVLQEAGILEGAERSVFRRNAGEYRAFLEAKKDASAVMTMRTAGDQGGITGIFVPGARTMSLPRLARGTPPPRLDGDLGDPAWRAAASAEQYAAVADRFSRIGGSEPAAKPTRVLATYDDESLYVSFRCTDSEVVATERAADDPGIYSDDCVEFFFSAGAEDPLEYWHLTVNPLNARWDALTTNRTQMDVTAGFAWESATSRGEGTWAVEMRIPFRLLRLPGSTETLAGAPVGATWRVNLTRQDKPSNENSSWSPVERGFIDNPSEFGRWTFPR